MENGKINSDCLKNVKRCPSTTFMKKFNKKTGFSSPKNLSIMVRVRYSGTNMRIFAMNLCVCPYWPCKKRPLDLRRGETVRTR